MLSLLRTHGRRNTHTIESSTPREEKKDGEKRNIDHTQ